MLLKHSGSRFHLAKKFVRYSNFSTSSLAHNEVGSAIANMKQFSVVGSGQMGVGIALVAAKNLNLPIINLYDNSSTALDKGHKFMASLLEKDLKKNKITNEEKERILSKVKIISDIEHLAESDFVVEAIKEDFEIKKQVFGKLDQVVKKDSILATNTSSIPITKIAAATKRPEQVIGMHFMNPVPVMKLVEVIPGLATSQHTLDLTLELSKQMGKITTLSKDTPGFIANRLLMPFINEAVFALQEGVATKEDIDTTMKLGTNHPMGPLTLADFIGLDTCLAIMEVLHTQIGDPKYRAAGLLRQYVEAGWLGKKSGRGFYTYE